jgi:indolepyruvate ferredoxin oxidoreductase alpha subunit
VYEAIARTLEKIAYEQALTGACAGKRAPSTFHGCLPLLYDAVQKQKQFMFVIMDDGTTAMTEMQPVPRTGITADGSPASSIMIEDIVKGFRIEFLKVIDPHDVPLMIATLKDSYDCPALTFDEERRKVRIDQGVCVKSGMCCFACPTSAEGKSLRKFRDERPKGKG